MMINQKTVTIGTSFDVHSLLGSPNVKSSVVVRGYALNKIVGNDNADATFKAIYDCHKHLKRVFKDDTWIIVFTLEGTEEQLFQEAERFADYLIELLPKIDNEDDFCDYVPSAFEELACLCYALDDLSLLYKVKKALPLCGDMIYNHDDDLNAPYGLQYLNLPQL